MKLGTRRAALWLQGQDFCRITSKHAHLPEESHIAESHRGTLKSQFPKIFIRSLENA